MFKVGLRSPELTSSFKYIFRLFIFICHFQEYMHISMFLHYSLVMGLNTGILIFVRIFLYASLPCMLQQNGLILLFLSTSIMNRKICTCAHILKWSSHSTLVPDNWLCKEMLVSQFSCLKIMNRAFKSELKERIREKC